MPGSRTHISLKVVLVMLTYRYSTSNRFGLLADLVGSALPLFWSALAKLLNVALL